MSNFSTGQMNLLGNAFEAAGWTTDHVTKLGQCGRLADIRAFLEGKAEIVMKQVEEKIILPLLQLVKTFTLGAVKGKKTSECFTNKSRYYYRDSNLDKLLDKSQPDQVESGYSVYQLTRGATFLEAVANQIGITGDVTVLAAALQTKGAITTLSAIEALIERQESGEDVGLRTDGWGNFFFVEDKDGNVSVVLVDRDEGRWGVSVRSLENDDRWDTGRRFFFRN